MTDSNSDHPPPAAPAPFSDLYAGAVVAFATPSSLTVEKDKPYALIERHEAATDTPGLSIQKEAGGDLAQGIGPDEWSANGGYFVGCCSDAALETLKDSLIGTAETLSAAMEQVGLGKAPIEGIEDRLLDDAGGGAVELCSGCEWWFHSCMLTADGDRLFCDQCQDDE